MPNSTLYIFVDESGNFDFSSRGTKYFVLTVMSTTEPFIIGSKLLDLRYQLLPNYSCGPAMEENGEFHATEDKQEIRNKVFSVLIDGGNLRIDSVIAQKNKANPVFHKQDTNFYGVMGKAVLRYSFNRAAWGEYKNVVVVFSSLFDKRKRGSLKQIFKSIIKDEAKVPFSLYFHSSKFDLCCQAADYFGWAIYRKWESNDERSYKLIQHLVKTEFYIFDKGTKEYY